MQRSAVTNRPPTSPLLGILALAALAAAGCSGGGAGESAAVPAAAVADESVTVGDLAASFTLPTLDGAEWRLADAEGTVRLIDFWATWCAPCREEVPMLNELQARYGEQGFTIVAIADSGDAPEGVREFVDELGVEYLTLLGDDAVFGRYDVLGLPTAFLVDRDGHVVETYFGAKPEKALEKRIRELLERPGPV